ncbi:CLUMA_CG016757, isoform A [Clunio marinus]|uniref:CLUMA_CG016757, isoform A n=1 Tax=Clunio marinus TaxID=568069 RepID=A0A1J1IW80_9DIPT|nr:CLUMA_CG016757, isoform A [Clunio marinus]
MKLKIKLIFLTTTFFFNGYECIGGRLIFGHSGAKDKSKPASHSNYGSTFGSSGLNSNTYIHNNYYRSEYGGSSFLTSALFNRGRSHNSFRHRSWSDKDDRRWRMTTKAPYFENKIPGSEKILPAAAVVGAATAFGLISLLPLNVPAFKPLMYCNGTEFAQSPINIDDKIYRCSNKSILISSCDFINENQVFNEDDKCVNKTMECHSKHSNDEIFCDNGTLLSRSSLVCNSTTFLNGTKNNETLTILNCFKGEINAKLASFIPTTTTEEPSTTTTEKNLSVPSRIHVFFMKIIGKEEALKKITTTSTTTTTTDDPRLALKEDDKLWAPEAMTIPPTTTTEAPYVIMKRWIGGRTLPSYDKPATSEEVREFTKMHNMGKGHWMDYHFYTKVLITTESTVEETTTIATPLITEVYSGGPYVMMKISENKLLELNTKEYLEYKVSKVLGKEYFYEDNYVKVPFNNATTPSYDNKE